VTEQSIDSVSNAYLNWLQRVTIGALLALTVALPAPFMFVEMNLSQMLALGLIVAGLAICFPIWRILEKTTGTATFRQSFERDAERQTNAIERVQQKHATVLVVLSALLSLLLELVVIRWQTSEIEFLAFFKNFGLIACFAGLGIGYSLSRVKLLPLGCSTFLLTLQVVFVTILARAKVLHFLHQPPVVEQVSIASLHNVHYYYWITAYVIMAFLFVSTALAFIPIGQLCGATMNRMKTLHAYGANLFGSLIGVLLMTVLSYFWAPPVIWYSICAALLVAFGAYNRRAATVSGLTALLLLALVGTPLDAIHPRIYSPYQSIDVYDAQHGWGGIRASGYYYQKAYDLTKPSFEAYPDLRKVAAYYDLPYKLKPHPKNVLILGAGCGNDVAAAVRAGAEHIDAVEIDPAIASFGKSYHPEKPYDNERVHLVLNDGRAFLRRTQSKYDVVVFALIDSHALSSSASALRVDSYIYTIQCFKEAKEKLNEGGILSLSFVGVVPDLQKKVFGMLKTVFDGKEPLALQTDYDSSTSFFESPTGAPPIPEDVASDTNLKVRNELAEYVGQFESSTDDWPFFYMPHRKFPFSYLPLMGLVLALAIWLQSSLKKSKFSAANLPYFWLGAGFMLVETKAITELGLQFGNTWLVTAIVVGAVISMAFLSNLLVAKVSFNNIILPGVLLIAALVFSALVSRHIITGFESSPWLMTAVLTCPIAFSGILFSTLISKTKDIAGAMALNILGALFGGILEYNAMYFGYAALYLIAIGIYVIAIVNVFMAKERAF
jgi:Spermine/spermidine synthase domain